MFFSILVYILLFISSYFLSSTVQRISDKEKQKKRLHFSTVYKGLSVNLFHAKIPLTGLQNNVSMFAAKAARCAFNIEIPSPSAGLCGHPCTRCILLTVVSVVRVAHRPRIAGW